MNDSTQSADDGSTGKIAGLIRRYDKHKKASDAPLAMDWIKAIYKDAIEYTGMPKTLRGGLLAWGMISVIVGVIMLYFISSLIFINDWLIAWGSAACMIGIVAFVIYSIIFTGKLELFGPDDAPTLFDRKNRKIYRMSRQSQPGFAGLFKPWPLVADEYDWDLVDCEHYATLNTTGSNVYRNHTLQFMIRQSETDSTLVDAFQLGNGMVLDDALADGVWEHIRRFMEEGGPALPPGQGLADRTPPDGWWQSMGTVGPFGPKYFEWWRDSFGIALISHIGIPVFLPLNFLWGTGNWLSYKTSVPVVWSPQVQQAIGPVLRHG